MELPGKIISESYGRRRSEHEVRASLKQSLQTGILDWQELADIPFQELIERVHFLNTLSEETDD